MPLFVAELGPHLTQHNATGVEAYLRTKWHLDPSNRLCAGMFQTDRTTVELTCNGPPKMHVRARCMAQVMETELKHKTHSHSV